MSLQELQALEFPKFGTDVLARKFLRAKAKLARRSKLAIKRARSRALVNLKSQYYVTSAARDLKLAAARNEDILAASLILTISLCFSFMNMAGETMLLFFQTGYDIAELSGVNMAVLLLIVCSILGIVGGWLTALLLNMLSFSVMDGANRKQYRSFRSTARKSLQYASRITGAWAALLLVLLTPLIAIAVPSFYFVKGALNPLGAMEQLFPYAATAGLASTVLLLINYGLVPYVALFEPELPLHRALDRSHQLVRRRGRLFILSIYGLLASLIFCAYVLAAFLEQNLKMPAPITIAILSMAAILYINCLLVMLYRKRKQARVK